MGFLKRLAFYMGLMLGLLTIAAAGTVAFTYLFTGKFASIEMAEGKPEVTLMTPDEVVTMVREQVDKAKAEAEEGGMGDDAE
ncbi:MAG: hypothetical protein PVH11_14095 [Anaerolineae bacterium]|jgi:hypothetical protein